MKLHSSFVFLSCIAQFLSVDVEVGTTGDTTVTKQSVDQRREEILWLKGRDNTPPTVDATVILMPDQISKISRYSINHKDPRKNTKHKCGFDSVVVVFDQNGDLMMVAIDNFFQSDYFEYVRDYAIRRDNKGAKWKRSPLHPSNLFPNDIAKGNGFPGYRADPPRGTHNHIKNCLKPVLPIFDTTTNLFNLQSEETIYGLVVPMSESHGVKWLDAQRMAHTDIRWDIGSSPAGVVATSYASVYSFTRDWNESGTTLWVEHETGYSLLKTVQQNNEVYGRINLNADGHLHPELNMYKELSDPVPQHLTSHPWCNASVIAKLRYNRFVLYDGRRMHQQYFFVEDFDRLVSDPVVGRLTMNSFFWARPLSY